jgi:hypothetical protein
MKRIATTDLTKWTVVSMRSLLVTFGECTFIHLNIAGNSAIENRTESCYTNQHHHTSAYSRNTCNFSVNNIDHSGCWCCTLSIFGVFNILVVLDEQLPCRDRHFKLHSTSFDGYDEEQITLAVYSGCFTSLCNLLPLFISYS